MKCQKCGRFPERMEMGIINGESSLCMACCALLQVPYKHPLTGERVDFNKPDVMSGLMKPTKWYKKRRG